MTFATCESSARYPRRVRHPIPLLVALVAAVGSAIAAAAFAEPSPGCRGVVPKPNQHIRWFSPDEASRGELARWCASVGPAIFEAPPLREGEPARRLVVISWNVHVGAGDVETVISRLQHGDFTGGHPVRDFVLLLQEAFRAGEDVPPVLPFGFRPPSRIAPAISGRAREDVRTIAARRHVSVLYVPSMRNGGVVRPAEDRGNAIVSTLPLEQPTAIELPIERQRRVAVSATVRGRRSDGSEWVLRLVDVHLDTALALLRGGPFGARQRQAEALVASVSSDMPTLVAGDFNTWGGTREPALAVMRRAFPESSADAAQTRPTFAGPLGFRAALDHVFARGVPTVELRRIDDRFGSDHFPVIVELGF